MTTDVGSSNTFNVLAETAPVATVTLNSHAGNERCLDGHGHEVGRGGNPVALSFIWTVNGVVQQSFTSASR